jgi:hypothetical protein
VTGSVQYLDAWDAVLFIDPANHAPTATLMTRLLDGRSVSFAVEDRVVTGGVAGHRAPELKVSR